MSIATLPTELYITILSHVPPSHLQTSFLNLSRAIPLSPVPLRPLFEHISVSRPQQLPQLYRRLKYPPQALKSSGHEATNDEPTWVKSFRVLIWQLDADVLLNVLALLPNLKQLSLRIGPTFAPEHLQDMFKNPAFSLSILSLRFRPYVDTATYYQFLKGSYFDTILDLISSWSSDSSLTRLSIVQDPLPRLPEGTHNTFAQPIVFFSLHSLMDVSLAPATQKVTHVRIRVPSRQIVPFLGWRLPDKLSYPFPNANFLDISTSSVRDIKELEPLLNLVGSGRLRHLLLDNTGICDGSAGDWELLGRTCVLAGVKPSRDREKDLKSWMQTNAVAGNDNQDDIDNRLPGNAQDRPSRRGRKGLATATISLRDRDSAPSPIASASIPPPHAYSPQKPTKIRIRPSPPRLLSLCVKLSLPSGQHSAEIVRTHEANALSDFSRGWSEGLEQLRSIWNRLRQSQSNGIKVFLFDIDGQNAVQGTNDLFHGLVEMSGSNNELWDELDTLEPPVLCFSGPRGEDYSGNEWSGHPDGCGHRISEDIWNDSL
ncbi:hypothetical protein JB92DRAFT_2796477 [Gautieria morchelliformis]|nr:hypothetical protein JB92DRAFT_2796477 [Gautieria morchelliformis]